MYYHEGAVE